MECRTSAWHRGTSCLSRHRRLPKPKDKVPGETHSICSTNKLSNPQRKTGNLSPSHRPKPLPHPPEGVKCLNSHPLLEYLRHASRIATQAVARLLNGLPLILQLSESFPAERSAGGAPRLYFTRVNADASPQPDTAFRSLGPEP